MSEVKKLIYKNVNATPSRFVGEVGQVTIDPVALTMAIHDGHTVGGLAIGGSTDKSISNLVFTNGLLTSYTEGTTVYTLTWSNGLLQTIVGGGKTQTLSYDVNNNFTGLVIA